MGHKVIIISVSELLKDFFEEQWVPIIMVQNKKQTPKVIEIVSANKLNCKDPPKTDHSAPLGPNLSSFKDFKFFVVFIWPVLMKILKQLA